MPLPFTLGAEGLTHAGRSALLCFPLWELLSPLANLHPYAVGLDCGCSLVGSPEDAKHKPYVRITVLFWVAVLAAGQSGLKHNWF